MIDAAVQKPIDVVIDGTDGAGKTHCVQFLLARLAQRGWRAVTCAPYKEQEVYPLWEAEPLQAAEIIVAVMNRFRLAHPEADVVVWDRGWPTAFVSTNDARARSVFEPLPPITVLLLSTVQRTQHKAQRHGLTGEWVSSEALVQHYNTAYHRLETPMDRDVLRAFPDEASMFDFEQIARSVQQRLERLTVG